MVQVQNKVNYGLAYVSQEQADGLGADWQEGNSLVKPPFVPPWQGEVSDGSTTPTPVVPVTLQRVDVVYKPGFVVEFTAIKGAVNDPDGDETFFFATTAGTHLQGYVGRTFSKTFPGVGPYSCSLEDLYGDGVNDGTRKKVTFNVSPVAAEAVTGEAVVPAPKKTTRKAPVKKG